MTTKTIGGLVSVMGFAALVIGCSGGDSTKVDDPSQGDGTPAPAGASLPKKTDSAPSKGGTAGKPSGSTDTSGKPGGGAPEPAKPGQPGPDGQPDPDGQNNGQDGQNGRISNGSFCCYNGAELTCDAVACFGGFDEQKCSDGCNGNFDCVIACVKKLGTAPPPTAACKATGKKC